MITALNKRFRRRGDAGGLRPRVAFVSGVAACAFFMTVTGCASQPAAQVAGQTPSTPLATDIAAYARETLEQTGLASLQIAIAHNGAVVFSEAYGEADVELGVEASSKTRYRTASISKWFTATAAMGLAEAGALDLDAPIQTYCPEFPEKAWTVTARHLLGHASGIRHYRDYSEEYVAAQSDEERRAVEQAFLRDRYSRVTRYTDIVAPLAVFSEEPLLFEPGTEYLYSSFGYRALGCVIEGAAGQPYRDVLRDRLFSPVGMADTVEDDAWAIIPNRASGYDLEDDGALRRTNMRDVSENLPAGGHVSTAKDLVLFAQAYGRGDLVAAATKSEMLAGLVDGNAKRLNEVYGLGVRTYDFGPNPLIGHDGSQAGATTILLHDRDTNLSVAILTNTRGWDWENTENFARNIYAIAAERLSQNF